jgi:hypothetical protein
MAAREHLFNKLRKLQHFCKNMDSKRIHLRDVTIDIPSLHRVSFVTPLKSRPQEIIHGEPWKDKHKGREKRLHAHRPKRKKSHTDQ